LPRAIFLSFSPGPAHVHPSPVSSPHAQPCHPTGTRLCRARVDVTGPPSPPPPPGARRAGPLPPSHFPSSASVPGSGRYRVEPPPSHSLSLVRAKTAEQSTLTPPSPAHATFCLLPSLGSAARHWNWPELCRRFPPPWWAHTPGHRCHPPSAPSHPPWPLVL
jgi:hypothetical protein